MDDTRQYGGLRKRDNTQAGWSRDTAWERRLPHSLQIEGYDCAKMEKLQKRYFPENQSATLRQPTAKPFPSSMPTPLAPILPFEIHDTL